MATSGICVTRNCVVRINTDGTEVVIPTDIDALFKTYQDGIVAPVNGNDPITRLKNEYSESNFNSSVSAVNSYFVRDNIKNLVNDTDYPLLNQRLNTGFNFTPIEIAEFTIEYGYTPVSLATSANTISLKLINEFEGFYTKSFSESTMGSFCSLLPDIFGAIDMFYNALYDIKALVNKLKNFSLEAKLTALVDRLKSQISKVIDKIVDKVKSAIENFSMENVISKIKTKINDKIGAEFQALKENAMKFFDELNIENFKKRIDSLVDYATGIFKDPKLEDIQFILYRFCGFITAVEDGINALKNPIDSYVNSYKRTVSVLQANSAYNTVRSVRAGAIRLDADITQAGVEQGNNLLEAAGNAPPLTSEDFSGVIPWNNGLGNNKIIFDPTWSSQLGPDGWEKIDIRVRAMLMKVQRDFGKPITLTSGFIPPWYNKLVGGEEGEENNLHLSGLACDCAWARSNDESRARFVQLARYHGFRGIGRYGPLDGNFVHIDVGRERTWSVGLPDENTAPTEPYRGYDGSLVYNTTAKLRADVAAGVYNGKNGQIVRDNEAGGRLFVILDFTDGQSDEIVPLVRAQLRRIANGQAAFNVPYEDNLIVR